MPTRSADVKESQARESANQLGKDLQVNALVHHPKAATYQPRHPLLRRIADQRWLLEKDAVIVAIVTAAGGGGGVLLAPALHATQMVSAVVGAVIAGFIATLFVLSNRPEHS